MTTIKRIRTHPGHAHRDEFMACCIALAVADNEPVITRSDDIPTEAFEDPETWILDVGERHEPDLNNFDHHQLPKEHDACCAFTLVLRKLGLYDDALLALPWVRMLEIWDSKGPISASKYLEYEQQPYAIPIIKEFLIKAVGENLLRKSPAEGLSQEDIDALVAKRADSLAKGLHSKLREKNKTWSKVMVPMLSPVDTFVLNDFQALGEIEPMYNIWVMMKEIGIGILQTINDFKEAYNLLKEHGQVVDVQGIKVLINPETSRNTNSAMATALDAWRKAEAHDVAVSIAPDERGPGHSLYRFDDDPRVDFGLVAGLPGVRFVHTNGFIAKTDTRDIEQSLELVRLAVKPSV